MREILNHAMTNSMVSLRLAIVDRADIICATLSGSGLSIIEQIRLGDTKDDTLVRVREYDVMSNKEKRRIKKPPRRFGTIVVDEAAQCNELLSIIPFRYSSERCVMVGDPKQLSSVTFSKSASRAGYDRSLFERLQRCGVKSHLLDTQYRCRPEIANFSSFRYYRGLVQNGPNVVQRDYTILPSNSRYLRPFMLYDLLNSEESRGFGPDVHSFRNVPEAEFVCNLIHYYLTKSSCQDSDSIRVALSRIGVITPYRSQIYQIERCFQSLAHKKGWGNDLSIEINSVDAFQGREKDIIIFSCVRSEHFADRETHTVGFLRDPRRLNVALTRAKYGLWIVGHCQTLQNGSSDLRALVNYAKGLDCMECCQNAAVPLYWG